MSKIPGLRPELDSWSFERLLSRESRDRPLSQKIWDKVPISMESSWRGSVLSDLDSTTQFELYEDKIKANVI
jgi:hypothetical protein